MQDENVVYKLNTQFRRTFRAFTLVELLITISLIVILVGILTVALSAARTAAQVAETQSRLTSLKQATVRFKDDVGYYPAVLDPQRNLALPFPVFPSPTNNSPQQMYRYQAQDWYSITSPAEFLMGYGNQAEDGYGRLVGSNPNDSDYEEIPRLGIRHPSVDGVWRATDTQSGSGNGNGLLTERVPSPRGKLYGPYLEVENDQMFGRIAFENDGVTPLVDPVTGNVKIFYPGDPNYDIEMPMVIVDTWGIPIRYYRPIYPNPSNPLLPLSGIARTYPPSNRYSPESPRPTLSDFIALRPYTFSPNNVIDASLPDFMDGIDANSGDTSTSMELQVGRFAYFSSGPDQQMNPFIRADYVGLPGNDDENATDEANADNIVEVGP